jgi:hypothetical protein
LSTEAPATFSFSNSFKQPGFIVRVKLKDFMVFWNQDGNFGAFGQGTCFDLDGAAADLSRCDKHDVILPRQIFKL